MGSEDECRMQVRHCCEESCGSPARGRFPEPLALFSEQLVARLVVEPSARRGFSAAILSSLRYEEGGLSQSVVAGWIHMQKDKEM